MKSVAERMDEFTNAVNTFALIIELLFFIFIIFLILSFLDRKGYLKKIRKRYL